MKSTKYSTCLLFEIYSIRLFRGYSASGTPVLGRKLRKYPRMPSFSCSSAFNMLWVFRQQIDASTRKLHKSPYAFFSNSTAFTFLGGIWRRKYWFCNENYANTPYAFFAFSPAFNLLWVFRSENSFFATKIAQIPICLLFQFYILYLFRGDLASQILVLKRKLRKYPICLLFQRCRHQLVRVFRAKIVGSERKRLKFP